MKYPNKIGGKVIVISVNRGDYRAKRATRFMYLGKTIEDTMRGTRWQYFTKCFIINNTISFKFTEIGNKTVLSRLRWVLCKLFKICLDKLYALANPLKLPRSVLKDLLVFTTKRSHFVFDGQYYDQIDGVAMGLL